MEPTYLTPIASETIYTATHCEVVLLIAASSIRTIIRYTQVQIWHKMLDVNAMEQTMLAYPVGKF